MSKYKAYTPVVLIVLLFFALVYFRNQRKDTRMDYITKNNDYSRKVKIVFVNLTKKENRMLSDYKKRQPNKPTNS